MQERNGQPTTPAMTAADIAAHQAASYVRSTAQDDDPNGPRLPKIPDPRKPRTTISRLDLVDATR